VSETFEQDTATKVCESEGDITEPTDADDAMLDRIEATLNSGSRVLNFDVNDIRKLLALARLGDIRFRCSITTKTIATLEAFQKDWLAIALQQGDTVTINGVEYISKDGNVWWRVDRRAAEGGGSDGE
jgi:translation initiation factor IF-1